MIQAIPKHVTFDEFIAWYPEDGRYELIDGQVMEMQPTGKHEEVTEFISRQLILETSRLRLPYRFPTRALVKAPSWETGYLPDVLIVDRNALRSEPLWEKAATITQGTSIGSMSTLSALTLNPSPCGRGTLKSCSPSPCGRRGWGMRAARSSTPQAIARIGIDTISMS